MSSIPDKLSKVVFNALYRMGFAYFILPAVFITASCTSDIYSPYDVNNSAYKITQTFGQLIMFDGALRPAHFMILETPANAAVKAFANGTVTYVADFQGLGPTVILDPKDYLTSINDFDPVDEQSLPGISGVKFAFSNLNPSEVESKIQARFAAVLSASDPGLSTAGQKFVAGNEGYRVIDVVGGPTPAAQTELGNVDGNQLYITAFTGSSTNVKKFINPLPYLMVAIPDASKDMVDNVKPVFEEVWIAAADNAAMLGAVEYQVPASNIIQAPNVLFGHIAIRAKLTDTTALGGQNIGIYEFAYEINRVTRNPDQSIASRTLVSRGRHLGNEMTAGALPTYLAVYDSERSSGGSRTFVYKLHFDTTSPPDSTPKVRNYLSEGNNESLDVTSLADGEYEFVLKARDARMPASVYENKTLYATITSDPAAISAAKWELQASLGAASTTIDNTAAPGFLIIPGTAAPLTVNTQVNNAPAVSAPAVFRYAIKSNNTDVDPATDTGLFPAGNNLYTGLGAVSPLTFSGQGLHDLVVWLDQDGDGTQQPSEPYRRMVIMTYQITVAITAERKHLGAGYAALAPNTLIPTSDSLKLTATPTGFMVPGDAALVTYAWEVTTPAGIENDNDQVWEKDPLTQGGNYSAKVIVDLFGVKFEQTWDQTVVGANLSAIEAICENEDREVTATLTPSPLPGGAQVNYQITNPAPATDGEARFTAGGTATTGNASGTLQVHGTTVSTAKDNVRLTAMFDGAAIAQDDFSICKIEFLKSDLTLTTSLMIALWDDAYNAAAGNAVRNDAAPANNFIDRDKRKIFLRILDQSKNTDPAVADSFEAEVATSGAIVDNFTKIRMTETGPATGIFDSKSQILVTDDIPVNADDDFQAHDGFGGTVADDATGDRTHKVAIDGRMLFRYTNDPGATQPWERSLPVCQQDATTTCDRAKPGTPCKVEFNVTVFNEPFDDVGVGAGNGTWDFLDVNGNGVVDAGEAEAFTDNNGNGIWDAGEPLTDTGTGAGNNRFDFHDRNGNGVHDGGAETSEPFIDFSSGSHAMGVIGSRGPVEPNTAADPRITDHVTRAKLSWPQACIEVDGPLATHIVDAEKNGAGDDIIADGAFDEPGSGEETIMAHKYKAAASIDVVEVFFVGESSGNRAYTAMPDYSNNRITGGAPAADTFEERTFIFVDSNLGPLTRTLAHELGHALTNKFDAANPDWIFFPQNHTTDDNVISQRRRLDFTNAGRIGPPLIHGEARTQRPAGNLTATGNRLLKNP